MINHNKLHHFQKNYLAKKILRNYIPSKLTNRAKHGFEVPIKEWLLGKNKDSHAPSIWISPGGTKLVFWQSTTESLNGEYIGPTQETGYRKWNHLVYTLKENQVKIFTKLD